MKIVFTVNTYYPCKDGVSVVTTYQAEGLAKKGHEVLVLTGHPEGELRKEMHNGVMIERDDLITVHAIHRGDKKEFQNKIIELSKNVDVIINVCLQTSRSDWMLPIIDKLYCKTMLYMHGMLDFSWKKQDFSSVSAFAHKVWNTILFRKLYFGNRKNIEKYDLISHLHQFDTANLFFEKNYNVKGKTFILENAADDAFFSATHIGKKQKKYMIYVANFDTRKNQKMCLRAFYLAKLPDDFQMILIGSSKTDYYHELKKYEAQLEKQFGKRNVKILTDIPREEIARYVSEATFYVMSSRWEAFPISIVEAMAVGIPFISTDVGVTRYMPGGVIAKSVEDMAYWMEVLSTQVECCNKLGESGREYAQKQMTIEKKVDELENRLLSIYDGLENE